LEATAVELKITSKHSEGLVARKLAVNLFLLLVSVYILTASGNSVDVTDDGMVRYSVTQQMVEKHTLDLPTSIGARWGIRGQDGRYFTNHGLGQSLVAVPFYLVGSWLGNPKFAVSLIGPFAVALTCVVIFFFGCNLKYSLGTSVYLALLGGLCTQLWPESKSPFDHAVEGLFILLSSYNAYAFLRGGGNRRLVIAGVTLGIATITRVTGVLWVLPLSLLFVMQYSDLKRVKTRILLIKTALGWFLLGFAPFAGFLLWYNAYRFGSILETGYSIWAQERHFSNFCNPLWIGLAGEILSPGKGVLLYSPVLILSLIGLRAYFRWSRITATVMFFASAMYLLFFARYAAWHGDIAWGPRYLVFLIPSWILFLGPLLERQKLRRRLPTSIGITTLVVIGFLVQLGSVLVDMNLHYFRLLRSGVVQNINTYSYPPSVYFTWSHSPLVDRAYEVHHLFHSFRDTRNDADSGTPDESYLGVSTVPALNFWWTHSPVSSTAPSSLILVVPFIVEICISSVRIKRLLQSA